VQPKIYSFEQHQIHSKNIDKHAYYVIQKLIQNGFKAYLVGGSVRDLLLNRKPKDFDISTSAKPEAVRKLFRNCLLIGKRFRLAHVRFGAKIIEVATFRAGDPLSENLIVRDNIYGTPEEDVMRRDFTINGLFYDVQDQTIIDYVGGVEDAKEKTLKTIGIAETRFRQDPVRMIRLLKFKARFDFIIDPIALEALFKCKEEIIKSSQARILEELFKMLESGSSERFFQYLHEYGLLTLLLPKLASFLNKNTNFSIYKFLSEIDKALWKDLNKKIDRAILLSCILFPLLEEKVQKLLHENEKVPHLGIIADISDQLINDVFKPFFLIPRKIKIKMISILTSQYRLTPLYKKPSRRRRIPKDPYFLNAFKFFKIRASVDPKLLKSYTEWNELIFKKKA
jgi:poly(A) polymerase